MKISAQFRLIIAVASVVSASTAMGARRPIVIDEAIVRPIPVTTTQLVRREAVVNPARDTTTPLVSREVAVTPARATTPPLVRREAAVTPARVTTTPLVRREVAVTPTPVTTEEPGTAPAPLLVRWPPVIITTTKKPVVSAL